MQEKAAQQAAAKVKVVSDAGDTETKTVLQVPNEQLKAQLEAQLKVGGQTVGKGQMTGG